MIYFSHCIVKRSFLVFVASICDYTNNTFEIWLEIFILQMNNSELLQHNSREKHHHLYKCKKIK